MEIKLNLASKPYLNRHVVRLWLWGSCALLGVLLVLNGIYGVQNYRQMKSLESRFLELDAQVAGIQGAPAGFTPEKYAEVRKETALANEIVAADQFRWTQLLSRLEELTPAEVALRTIQPDFKARSVQLTGVARDISAMTRFVDNLLDSEDLNQAFLQRHGEVESDLAGSLQLQTGFALVIREAF